MVLMAVKTNGYAFRHASLALQEDKEIVLAAVKQHGNALPFAAPTLQENEEVIFAASQQNNTARKCTFLVPRK